MRLRRWMAATALLALAAPAEARRPPRRSARSLVVLDGVPTQVRWVDGDTFRVVAGPLRGRSARLEGYNTLESYGPVHRFTGWDPRALLAIARSATRAAAAGRWTCSAGGGEDAYRRVLVSCPEAAAALVRDGLAMVYAVRGEGDPALLALQREAQARGAGMWARGVPRGIVTSVHSAAEHLPGGAYNRVADTRTGAAPVRRHRDAYRTCQVVCERSGADVSCMTYVPFPRRFRGRPACLGPRGD